jgi:hypothetical protein
MLGSFFIIVPLLAKIVSDKKQSHDMIILLLTNAYKEWE